MRLFNFFKQVNFSTHTHLNKNQNKICPVLYFIFTQNYTPKRQQNGQVEYFHRPKRTTVLPEDVRTFTENVVLWVEFPVGPSLAAPMLFSLTSPMLFSLTSESWDSAVLPLSLRRKPETCYRNRAMTAWRVVLWQGQKLLASLPDRLVGRLVGPTVNSCRLVGLSSLSLAATAACLLGAPGQWVKSARTKNFWVSSLPAWETPRGIIWIHWLCRSGACSDFSDAA